MYLSSINNIMDYTKFEKEPVSIKIDCRNYINLGERYIIEEFITNQISNWKSFSDIPISQNTWINTKSTRIQIPQVTVINKLLDPHMFSISHCVLDENDNTIYDINKKYNYSSIIYPFLNNEVIDIYDKFSQLKNKFPYLSNYEICPIYNKFHNKFQLKPILNINNDNNEQFYMHLNLICDNNQHFKEYNVYNILSDAYIISSNIDRKINHEYVFEININTPNIKFCVFNLKPI